MARLNAATIGVLALFAVVVAGAGFFVMTKAPGETAEQALAPKASDIGMGDPNAPIKLIEYASLDCPHCADFALEVIPQLKATYIDTGKVYFVMRDSPRTELAAVGSMVVRCAAPDKFYALTDMLFENQANWLGQGVPNQKDALFGLLQKAGITADQIRGCITQERLDAIKAIQDEAVKALRLSGVPLIFVNGQEFTDPRSFEAFDAAFKAILGTPAPPATP